MENTQSLSLKLPARQRVTQALRLMGWISFAVTTIVFFTVAKLPEDRIKNFINGSISNVLSAQGIGFSTTTSKLSLLLGPTYTMSDVNLSFPPPQPLVSFSEVAISPSLMSALLLRAGGSVSLTQRKNSTLQLNAWTRGSSVSADFSAKGLDLAALGLVPILTSAYGGIKAGGILSGTGNILGDLSKPQTLSGKFLLDLTKLVIEQQTIIVMNFPRASISEAKIAASIDKGRLQIQSLTLGKAGSEDDIIGSVSGDILLGQTWDSSTLSLSVSFSLSRTILNSFVFLDSLMGGAKQTDGSYRFKLSGPLTAPAMEAL